jgi:hypothetical protein
MNCCESLGRRDFFKRAATGLTVGGLTLHQACGVAAAVNDGHPLAPRPSHAPAKAKNLIIIFLTGGFSHVDTFDPKPRLRDDHGKIVSAVHLRGVSNLPLMASPFTFKQYGESGLWLSELFPHLATVADELCVIRSLHTDIIEHFQSVLAMHTGSATVPLPSIGSWLSYGLGTLNRNLPSYMVLAEHLPYAGTQVLDNNFLPPVHQGVRIVPGSDPIPDLKSTARSLTLAQLEQQMLHDANEIHATARPGDLNLRARMNSFDIARGMMKVAPEVFDLSRETRATLDMYGISDGDNKSIAWQCLMVRRLIEQGVRVVELIDTGSHNNWDAHSDMQDHRPKAKRVDQPLTALIKDLKQRGMLSETLIAICTEFGRTPWTDNATSKGRNHYAGAFTSLLLGAGVKGGTACGQTDDHGIDIVADPCHVNDYHATILHLMGIDHTRLTYRYAGRDFRLTDVHGKVMQSVLA